MYPLLIVRREVNKLSIAFQKIGKHPGGERLSIVHLKVPQVIEGIPTPDLAEVDDASVAGLVLVDVRHVEIAVRKPGLLLIEPGIIAIEDLPDGLDFSYAQNALT